MPVAVTKSKTSVKEKMLTIRELFGLSQEALDACDEVWHSLHPPRLFYGR